MPGVDVGLQPEDVTIAELLKPLGYATGQFGKDGPHMNTWPDAGMTPFRSEKNTNSEGAFRVPEVIRWPSRIPPRQEAASFTIDKVMEQLENAVASGRRAR